MEKNYNEVVSFDDDEGGLSLKAVGHFFAKAWLRAVIYVVIACVLATVIFLPIKMFVKSNERVSAGIELLYSGADDGLSYNGNNFSRTELVSGAIVTAAVAEAGLQGKVNDITELSRSISVTEIVTPEYLEIRNAANAANASDAAKAALTNYHATKFQINYTRVKGDDAVNLTDAEAIRLINAIVNQYTIWFKSNYISNSYTNFPETSFTNGIIKNEDGTDSVNSIELLTLYNSFKSNLSEVNAYLTRMTNNANSQNFTSSITQRSFSDIKTIDYKLLEDQLTNFYSFITSNNVWRNADLAKINQKAQLDALNNQKTRYDELKTEIKAQIASIEKNTTISNTPSGSTIITSYPPIYTTLQNQLLEYNIMSADLTVQIAETQKAYDNLDGGNLGSADQLKLANTMLETIITSAKNYVALVNDTTADYADYITSTSINKISPAVKTADESGISLLIIYVIAALLGLMVASIVTGVKIHKNNIRIKNESANSSKEVFEDNKQDLNDKTEN